jgi:hypothetical protein
MKEKMKAKKMMRRSGSDEESSSDDEELEEDEMDMDAFEDREFDESDLRATADLKFRGKVKQLYKALDKTQEWAEMYYSHVAVPDQKGGLVQTRRFWSDFAAFLASGGWTPGSKATFLSKNFGEACGNVNEALLVLAVLDVPFVLPSDHSLDVDAGRVTLTASVPLILFHKELLPTQPLPQTTCLVGQSYFDPKDRYQTVRGERTEKFITDLELLRFKVYGVKVVITNVASSRQKLNVLLQIPAGSIPVCNGFQTKGQSLTLGPYTTKTIEYLFYFPSAGRFPHYPVHVSNAEGVVAFASALVLDVVEEPTRLDTTSWETVSQRGTTEDVLHFLRTQPLATVNLSRVAWRMKDADVFTAVTDLLSSRFMYDATLWDYAFKHELTNRVREGLEYKAVCERACVCAAFSFTHSAS